MKVILAVDKNWAIGKDNKMLYDIKTYLAHFKNTTMGSVLIMGRKTFDSMGRALPGRENLILSRDKNLKREGAKVFNDIASLLSYVKNLDKETFLIGGAELVDLLIDYCDGAIITKIDATRPAEIFLHNFDTDPNFRIKSESDPIFENGLSFKYVEYERIKNER